VYTEGGKKGLSGSVNREEISKRVIAPGTCKSFGERAPLSEEGPGHKRGGQEKKKK